jgi:hypothetical protein
VRKQQIKKATHGGKKAKKLGKLPDSGKRLKNKGKT